MNEDLDYLDPQKRSVWDKLRLFVSMAKGGDALDLTPTDAVKLLDSRAQLDSAKAVLREVEWVLVSVAARTTNFVVRTTGHVAPPTAGWRR